VTSSQFPLITSRMAPIEALAISPSIRVIKIAANSPRSGTSGNRATQLDFGIC
jgi:hypothetical protein